MSTSHRNQQPFYYSLYQATAPIYDEYGNEIGMGTSYTNPVKAYGNISAAKGAVVARQFGDDLNYDRVILMADRDTPIDEYSVLWIDTTPELDANGALALDRRGNMITPWNYVVKSVARGLPHFGTASIAVKKVNVS